VRLPDQATVDDLLTGEPSGPTQPLMIWMRSRLHPWHLAAHTVKQGLAARFAG